jgi:hypothetical protein
MHIRKPSLPGIAFAALLALILLPWAVVQFNQSLNSDGMWLLEAARRLLAGGTMAGNAYETNPPLSIVIYYPPVLFSQLTGFFLPHAYFLYAVIILLLSAGALWKILAKNPVSSPALNAAITAAFILGNTVLSSIYFGERDQLLGMALLPFVLIQIGLTFSWPRPHRILFWSVLICGAALILLKPHFGLLPALLLLHRALHQRRLTLWKDPDFICLSLATAGYLLFIFTYCRDYVTIIFPDVVSLYLPEKKHIVVLESAFYIIVIASFFFLCYALPIEKHRGNLTAFLFFCALICIIPYWVQMRGFHYHLLPAQAFFLTALACMMQNILAPGAGEQRAAIAVTLMAAALSYSLSLPNPGIPTHKTYGISTLGKQLDACKDPHCSFFMFNNSLEAIHQIAFYAGHYHASRFPTLWFLPGLVRAQDWLDHEQPSPLNQKQVDTLKTKYARMIAEDFNSGKPELAFIGHFRVLDDKDFDFIDYFSSDPDFAASWHPYRKTSSFTLDMLDYYPDSNMQYEDRDQTLLTFDVYRRSD